MLGFDANSQDAISDIPPDWPLVASYFVSVATAGQQPDFDGTIPYLHRDGQLVYFADAARKPTVVRPAVRVRTTFNLSPLLALRQRIAQAAIDIDEGSGADRLPGLRFYSLPVVSARAISVDLYGLLPDSTYALTYQVRISDPPQAQWYKVPFRTSGAS